MPESNKMAKKRVQKANKLAGIGDEDGRIPSRTKEPPKLVQCAVCQHELKITKTNTELIAHSESKHGKAVEECFPGATKMAEELLAAVGGKGGGGKQQQGGPTKAERKKKNAAGLDDLLDAGLSGGGGKKKAAKGKK